MHGGVIFGFAITGRHSQSKLGDVNFRFSRCAVFARQAPAERRLNWAPTVYRMPADNQVTNVKIQRCPR